MVNFIRTSMDWIVLEKLWKRTLVNTPSENTWNNEIETLYRLGISMEDTLRYLYFENPDFETFKLWINKNKKEAAQIDDSTIENVLSEEDLAFWNENGYVIVKDAVSKKDCEATQYAIWEHLRMDPNDKTTWYTTHDDLRGLMLNFSDHETLNRNRFSQRVKRAYEQLYNTNKIYKTIDKVSFNPPETDSFKFSGSDLHWDVSLKTPIPFALQGLLYLTDCGPEDGAFHCVPGFHNKIENWLEALEPHVNPREEALKTLKAKPILGNAGDFIIWHHSLPHCATPNYGTAPRMVQYLTYFPDNYISSPEWI